MACTGRFPQTHILGLVYIICPTKNKDGAPVMKKLEQMTGDEILTMLLNMDVLGLRELTSREDFKHPSKMPFKSGKVYCADMPLCKWESVP